MPIELINFQDSIYPKFQAEGGASKFAIPFAEQVCKGKGFDIGYNRPEWKFPGAMGIDFQKGCSIHGVEFNDITFYADRLPESEGQVDYIFSSHLLEHLDRWVDVLDYWYTRLKSGGVLFLYLPDSSQRYWLPWHNRKHVSVFTPDIIEEYLRDKGYIKVMVSGVDLNSSFMCMAEK